MKRSMTAEICEGPILSSILKYTIPIILTGELQLLFNAADLIVVGRFCGSLSVAAVGATSTLTNLFVNLFMGLSIGVGVIIAQSVGAKDDKKTSRTVHTALPLAFICGVVLTVIGVVYSGRFLAFMKTPDDVINLSTVYMQIYFAAMTASMVYNFGASILRAAGDTKSPLVFLFIAGLLNVILNILFVTVFKMDVAGVALATALSQLLSAVLVVAALMKRDDACRFSFAEMRIHKNEVLGIVRLGLPAGIQGSLFSISNVIIQSSINSFGSAAVSGSAASSSIEGFVYIAMNSVSVTAVNFVGQNYGARRPDRIKKIIADCLMLAAGVGIVLGVGAYLLGRPLLGIYITDSPEAVRDGIERMSFICLTYFLCGIMDVTTGALRGFGVSLIPTVIAVMSICVMRVVWIYTVFLIPEYHTLSSLFVSYPISWMLSFAAQLIALVIVWKKKSRILGTQ